MANLRATSFRRRLGSCALLFAAAGAGATVASSFGQTPSPASPGALPPLVPGPISLPPPATQASPDTVIVTVGEEKVTVGGFEDFVASLPPQDQEMARGQYRRAWAESLVKMKLLAQEAGRRKLDEDPRVQRQLAIVREQVLANAMVNDVRERVDEATLRKYFEEHRQQLERVAARHILVRTPGSKIPLQPGQKELTEEQAKARIDMILQRLRAGEDFAKVARETSDDVGSGADGGDLGSFARGRMVAPFEQAAFAQPVGEIGNPVRSQFGWHVIQVTGRYDSLETLGETLQQQVSLQRTNELVRDLRQNTKVEMNESYLGPPVPDAEVDELAP